MPNYLIRIPGLRGPEAQIVSELPTDGPRKPKPILQKDIIDDKFSGYSVSQLEGIYPYERSI